MSSLKRLYLWETLDSDMKIIKKESLVVPEPPDSQWGEDREALVFRSTKDKKFFFGFDKNGSTLFCDEVFGIKINGEPLALVNRATIQYKDAYHYVDPNGTSKTEQMISSYVVGIKGECSLGDVEVGLKYNVSTNSFSYAFTFIPAEDFVGSITLGDNDFPYDEVVEAKHAINLSAELTA